MKRLVYASSPNLGQWVNKIGNYLKKNIDGIYKIAFHPMECELFMRMYYQIPEKSETFDEMHFIISITSYQNKIRVNLTEDTELEKTIGQIIFKPEDIIQLEDIRRRVLQMIKKSMHKEFVDFEFIY